jgi:hypothetical protein
MVPVKLSLSCNFKMCSFSHIADPRVKDWPMMSSPWPSVVICLTYCYLVTKTGPKLMENREPYSMCKFLVVFNIGMVGLSSYVFIEVNNIM